MVNDIRKLESAWLERIIIPQADHFHLKEVHGEELLGITSATNSNLENDSRSNQSHV